MRADSAMTLRLPFTIFFAFEFGVQPFAGWPARFDQPIDTAGIVEDAGSPRTYRVEVLPPNFG